MQDTLTSMPVILNDAWQASEGNWANVALLLSSQPGAENAAPELVSSWILGHGIVKIQHLFSMYRDIGTVQYLGAQTALLCEPCWAVLSPPQSFLPSAPLLSQRHVEWPHGPRSMQPLPHSTMTATIFCPFFQSHGIFSYATNADLLRSLTYIGSMPQKTKAFTATIFLFYTWGQQSAIVLMVWDNLTTSTYCKIGISCIAKFIIIWYCTFWSQEPHY